MRNAGVFLILVAFAGAAPAVAQPYCYETQVTLQSPSNPHGIDRVEYEWSTSATAGSAGGAFLISKRMKLWATPSKAGSGGPVLLYTDTAMTNGVPQPMGGASRSPSDILWDFDLDIPRLNQMVNVQDSTFGTTAGDHYQVTDGASIPIDGQVWIKNAIGGTVQWLDIEQVLSQNTKPDFDCNGTGDPVATTGTGVTTSPNSSAIGQNVTLTATVTSGQGIPNGAVDFYASTTLLGSASLNGSGVATLNTAFDDWGNRNITAEYGGTVRHAPSVSPIHAHWVRVPTTTTLMSSASVFPENVSVTLTATVDFDDDGFPAGSVTFKNGGATIGSANLSSGQATLLTSFAGGVHTLTAQFDGSYFDETSTSPPIQVTARFDTATALTTAPNPSAPGEPVDLTAVVTSSGGTPTGTVEFTDAAGGTYGQAALSGGQATVQTATLQEGFHSLTATFIANGVWRGSVSPEHAHQVSGGALDTATALVSSANPVNVGTAVTFTATVTFLGKQGAQADKGPKGGTTMTFRDGGVVIGQAPVNPATLQAQLTTSALSIGQRSIRAEFSGSPGLNPSLSPPLIQGVRAPTSTTLVSSLNPAFADEEFVLTATVTSPAGTPSGRADLWVFGAGPTDRSGTLDGAGQVTFDLSHPGAATVDYEVVYLGDGNRAPSTSNVVHQVSNDRPIDVSLGIEPAQGIAPVEGVDLAVLVGGTNLGSIEYFYYCHRPDGGTNVTEDYDLTDITTETVKVLPDVCSYAKPGTYTPKVIAQALGMAAEDRATVVVSGRPEVDFQFSPPNPGIGEPIQFTSIAQGPDLTYAWDFNNDGLADSAAGHPGWTFQGGATHPVTLVVSNAYGTARKTRNVMVPDPALHVASVTRQFAGSFLQATALVNTLTVEVNWMGATPGTVRVRVNGGAPQILDAAGGSATFNLNVQSLPASSQPSVLAFTPVSAGGVAGKIHHEYVHAFPLPGWLVDLEASPPTSCAELGGCPGDAPAADEFTSFVSFPLSSPALFGDVNFPPSMPVFAGPCQVLYDLSAAGTISSTRTTTQSVFGSGGIDCAGGFVAGKASGDFSLDLEPPGGLRVPGASLTLGGSGNLPGSPTVLGDAVPAIVDLFSDPVVGQWMQAIAQSSLSADLEANLALTAALHTVGFGAASRLEFRPANGALSFAADVETKGAPTGLLDEVELRYWIAGGGHLSLGVPVPFARTAQIALQFGAAVQVAGALEVRRQTEWSCNWAFADGPDATCVNNGSDKSGDPAGRLRVIDRRYAAHGRYAAFEPRRLDEPNSVRVPKSVANTELATNVFPGAAPHLTDLGDGEMLLVWLHQDPSDPLLQFTEVAWSRFADGVWSAPALIADDTRFEAGLAAAVDAQGRVVAAWQRIKDPAFATPVDTLADLPLFQSRYEIVTATYDPVGGTWGPITQLTDDDQHDRQAQIARGPGGELLLTWLSSSGDAWVSTAQSPVAVRYAAWDPGTASWGPAGDIATGLIGVAGYAAAYRGDSGVMLVSRDPDALLDADDVIEAWLWDSASWSGPLTFASGGAGHTRPQVRYDRHGVAQVVWLRGVQADPGFGEPGAVRDELVQATLADPTPHVIRAESDELGLTDVQFLSNAQGNLTLLWNRVAGGGAAQIHALIYDDEAGAWSEDRRLIDDAQRRTGAVSAIYGTDGVLRAAYLSTAIGRTTENATVGGAVVEIPNVPVEGVTDLRILEHSLIRDLAVSDAELTLTPPFPVVGEAIEARLIVHNAGDFVVDDFDVGLYVGEPGAGGQQVGLTTVQGPFAAGAAREVAFAFDFPAGGGDVVALVDPDTLVAELTRVNNQARRVVDGLPPLAVALADATSGDVPLVVRLDGSASTDPEGGALTYAWIFDDGSPAAHGPVVEHTFVAPGDFGVTLLVTDPTGRTASDTLSISVGTLGAGETTGVLGLDKNGGSVVLTWGDSCLASDTDYAVYRGVLGAFGSHVALACSTGGLTEAIADPGAGDSYFLVVPRNGRREGSYGSAGDGTPRPASTEACLPQLPGTCQTDCTPLSQWATSAFASTEFTSEQWSAMQATGVPDTLTCGDLPSAWSPTTPNVDPEWLEVVYETPVHATGVEIYETFATGGVVRIEVRDAANALHEVWSDTDPTTCEGVLNATWSETAYPISAVRIHTQIVDYEQIDAVQLHGNVCD